MNQLILLHFLRKSCPKEILLEEIPPEEILLMSPIHSPSNHVEPEPLHCDISSLPHTRHKEAVETYLSGAFIFAT